jgi:DnaD/phage-associated family protein
VPTEENSGAEKVPVSDGQSCLNTRADEKSGKEPLRYQRPDGAYIASRMQSSEEIYFLMQEAQVVLGRPISTGDSGILLMLYDNDGLPVDVIIMLLQYAVSVCKANMKYIEKTGIGWASEGINNLEKAEKKIQDLNRANISWKKFENIIGIYHRSPSAREEEAVSRWLDDWNYSEELVKEAYDRCVNANGKYVLKYMDSIVKRWHTQGIVTIEQALAENASRHKKKNSLRGDNEASYNIEEYENYNIFDYIQS